jgi:hypothetical protein
MHGPAGGRLRRLHHPLPGRPRSDLQARPESLRLRCAQLRAVHQAARL